MDLFSVGSQTVSLSPEVAEVGKWALIGYGIFFTIVFVGVACVFFKVLRGFGSARRFR